MLQSEKSQSFPKLSHACSHYWSQHYLFSQENSFKASVSGPFHVLNTCKFGLIEKSHLETIIFILDLSHFIYSPLQMKIMGSLNINLYVPGRCMRTHTANFHIYVAMVSSHVCFMNHHSWYNEIICFLYAHESPISLCVFR